MILSQAFSLFAVFTVYRWPLSLRLVFDTEYGYTSLSGATISRCPAAAFNQLIDLPSRTLSDV